MRHGWLLKGAQYTIAIDVKRKARFVSVLICRCNFAHWLSNGKYAGIDKWEWNPNKDLLSRILNFFSGASTICCCAPTFFGWADIWLHCVVLYFCSSTKHYKLINWKWIIYNFIYGYFYWPRFWLRRGVQKNADVRTAPELGCLS